MLIVSSVIAPFLLKAKEALWEKTKRGEPVESRELKTWEQLDKQHMGNPRIIVKKGSNKGRGGGSAAPKGGTQGSAAMSHNECNFIWIEKWDQTKEEDMSSAGQWNTSSFNYYRNPSHTKTERQQRNQSPQPCNALFAKTEVNQLGLEAETRHCGKE